jgi:alpha-L-fucosidase
MKMNLIAPLIAAVLLVASNVTWATESVMPETKEQHDARMKWWRDARFGMFIHWGLYAVPAGRWQGKEVKGIGEWIMNSAHMPVGQYEQLATQFDPEKFDARRWVAIAKGAGMRYIVITSKHHDGFNMFGSHESDYNIVKATPFHRDPMKELAAACQEAGITFCFYHSIMDWHHPDAQRVGYNDAKPNPNFPRYFNDYFKPELKDLLTNYGKLGILWFDGEWIKDWTPDMGIETYNFCRSIQPGIIVNNRVGKARAGINGMNRGEGAVGDYGTPEQEIPATGFPGVDWESCMTMNDTWGYKVDDHNWKSTETVLHMLIDCASKGGNFLLNVGPTAQGEIPPNSVARLAAIGKWMAVNSESIYATQASPFPHLAFGECTQKPGRLYLHVFDWPGDGKLIVPIRNKVTRAYLLVERYNSLLATPGKDGVTINVPPRAPDKIASVVAVEIEGAPEVIP